MSNNLKFRVFSKLEKKYLPSYADKGLIFSTNYGRDGEYHLVGVDWFITAEQYENPINYIVEQFTGLKDENENDIFEGDILKFENIGPRYFMIGQKTNNCGCCGYVYGYDLDNIQLDKIQLEAKVVGNINENPELLNK